MQHKNYAISAAMLRIKAKLIHRLKGFVSVTRAGVFNWENLHFGYRDAVSARLLMLEHIEIFINEWLGKISETEPARLTGLIF